MSANVSTQLPTRPRPATVQVQPNLSFRAPINNLSTMNPWEQCALEYQYSEEHSQSQRGQFSAWTQPAARADPIIYPGLYCPSGIDVMSILMAVASRPNPRVQLGAIDCSVALLLCDLAQPDMPIVYASDGFTELTGYTNSEIMGKNCRFLQAPGGQVRASSSRKYVDDKTVRKMRRALEANEEVQLDVINFKKDGTPFRNMLSMIPVRWNSQDFRYCVGFQVARE